MEAARTSPTPIPPPPSADTLREKEAILDTLRGRMEVLEKERYALSLTYGAIKEEHAHEMKLLIGK